MKKLLCKVLSGAMLAGMTACTSEKLDGPAAGGPAVDPATGISDPFYTTVKFNVPRSSGSRSGANNEGDEVGRDYENKIGSILVIMATKDGNDYKYLTSALNNAPVASSANTTHTIVFQNKTALLDMADKTGEEERTVYLFAICNPTDAIRDIVVGKLDGTTGEYTGGLQVGDTFVDEICANGTDANGNSVNITDTWRNNGFMMSSISMYRKTLESRAVLMEHDSANNPYQLGTISVVRTASRFDFRDASTAGNCTYAINQPNYKKAAGEEVVKMADVTLTRMSLTNLRNSFYYFPRVHSRNSPANTIYCPGVSGMEFITDTDNNPTSEIAFVDSPAGASYQYQVTFLNQDEIDITNPDNHGLKWRTIAEVLGGTGDSDTGWGDRVDEEGNPAIVKEGYHIFDYATENTFSEKDAEYVATAGGDLKSSINEDNVTGIVFEAEIVPADIIGAKYTTETVTIDGNTVEQKRYTSTMYLYDNIMYGDVEQVVAAIADNPTSTMAQAFDNAFTKQDDGTYKPASDEVLSNFGFTPYRPQNGRYYCYYFYYNRHVDDGNASEIGDMEFGTVRNNVYKIAVKNISNFGAFRPADPTEWDVFFEVSVEVRNWTVRVNDGIEF